MDLTCGELPPLSSVLQRSLLVGRLDLEIVAERSRVKSSLRWNRTPEEMNIVLIYIVYLAKAQVPLVLKKSIAPADFVTCALPSEALLADFPWQIGAHGSL